MTYALFTARQIRYYLSLTNLVKMQMQLLYTNCVQIILYACDVKKYSAKEMGDINTAINNAIRKIFSFSRWESVRALREGCGLKSIYDIFAIAKQKFGISLVTHHNSMVCFLHQIASVD